MTLEHTRTLKMSEEVLCVRTTTDNRLLAVALTDNTVKVFFIDSLKFFLSLYGHKFPVLCMDISDDNTLIATGSADKNIKIWGLDFGDCHKSIFAHDDSITAIQFLPKTHMFFSVGKDGKVKQWDADNFQKIITLDGHQAEIWTLAISPDGKNVVTASHDKSLRLWEKTKELLILQEEQEMEREEEENAVVGEDQSVLPGESSKDFGLPSKKTIETIKAAEKLIEALDIYEEVVESNKNKVEVSTQISLQMSVYGSTCPTEYMLEVLKKIKSSELEEALLTMPFGYIMKLCHVLVQFFERNWEIELTSRALFFLLKVHSGQISANGMLLNVIDKLRHIVDGRLVDLRDKIGFNFAGFQYLVREINARDEVALFTDVSEKFKEKQKKRRKRHRAVLVV